MVIRGQRKGEKLDEGSQNGRKAMTNLDSVLKSSDITVPTKVHIVKAVVFPVSCMDVRIGP